MSNDQLWNDQLWNVETVARLLGCSTRTVEDRARDGDLPGLKFGDGGWLFPVKALLERLHEKAVTESEKRRSERSGASAVPLAFHNPYPPTPRAPPNLGSWPRGNINGLNSLP